MTTSDRPDGATQPSPLAAAEDPAGPAAGRGRTTIGSRVVERIAARAVREAGPASGAARGLLGSSLGSARPGSSPRVSATVEEGAVSVAVSMSVSYPASVRQVTSAARRQVVRRVVELTGLEVSAVDIDVPSLVRAGRSRRRVG